MHMVNLREGTSSSDEVVGTEVACSRSGAVVASWAELESLSSSEVKLESVAAFELSEVDVADLGISTGRLSLDRKSTLLPLKLPTTPSHSPYLNNPDEICR